VIRYFGVVVSQSIPVAISKERTWFTVMSQSQIVIPLFGLFMVFFFTEVEYGSETIASADKILFLAPIVMGLMINAENLHNSIF